MKKLMIGLCLLSTTAIAQNVASLKSMMEDMGTNFKAISRALQSNSVNATTISQAESLVVLTQNAIKVTPDTVLSLPNVEQASAKQKYQDQMKVLLENTVLFRDALKLGKIDEAKALLVKLTENKKQGHQDFK